MKPLKFSPLLKSTLWGGDKIIPFKHLDCNQKDVGESWEISGVKDNESIVSAGEYQGVKLNDVVAQLKDKLLGKENYARFGNEFPLLIKFIDARQQLSIQVHPSDEIAKRQGKKSKKTEEKEATETSSESKKDEKEKIKFEVPIKGEILREFAKESLVYSNTLQEWVTHNGVDIKADKTSVVKAAAEGTVSAIKNDPRYGLTVIITHDDGYQTVYSNLLTAEFVVKGEKVEVGQSIGTVGNSASFEIEDEYHLHFELLKDNEYLNPVNYINFE